MGAGACYGEVKGHFPLLISYVSEVAIEEEAVKGKKQNSACYIVSSANHTIVKGSYKVNKGQRSVTGKQSGQFLFHFSKTQLL